MSARKKVELVEVDQDRSGPETYWFVRVMVGRIEFRSKEIYRPKSKGRRAAKAVAKALGVREVHEVL